MARIACHGPSDGYSLHELRDVACLLWAYLNFHMSDFLLHIKLIPSIFRIIGYLFLFHSILSRLIPLVYLSNSVYGWYFLAYGVHEHVIVLVIQIVKVESAA